MLLQKSIRVNEKSGGFLGVPCYMPWYNIPPCKWALMGRLHGAVFICVLMSEKPFDAEACDIGGQASATNGLSDMKTQIKNAPCNRPLKEQD
jgi:hypothetical protein